MTGSLLRRSLLLSAIGATLAGRKADAAVESRSIAGLDVTVWRPAGAGPAPVIVFSHGFHGCDTQSRFLMAAFAASGYIVFAPNHHDATCGGGSSRWSDPPADRFGKPASWDESSFHDRADDIRALVAALRADADWRDRIDWARLGVVGHSLGGYTALGLGGAWPGWKLDGVRAILALSPYVQPFLARHTLAGLAAPVMYQGATLDLAITPWLGKRGGAYDASPAPKYYVEFKRAGHLAWTDFGQGQHDAIVAYSVAFLDHYLMGNAAAAAVLGRATPAVAALRHDP